MMMKDLIFLPSIVAFSMHLVCSHTEQLIDETNKDYLVKLSEGDDVSGSDFVAVDYVVLNGNPKAERHDVITETQKEELKQQEQLTGTLTTNNGMKLTELSNVISSTHLVTDVPRPHNGEVVLNKERFDALAEKMKRNSDELVEILRMNAEFVVNDFIRLSKGLEEQIRQKSDQLLNIVHQSADGLASDSEKLASAIEKIYKERST